MNNTWYVTIASLMLSFSLSAAAKTACESIDVNDPSVPECPSSGSEILPETYPVMAAVVSDEGGGAKWVSSYVMATLKAQPQTPPQFLLPVTEETLLSVQAQIRRDAPDKKTADLWLSSLTRVPGDTWNWQQDYFGSFFNKQTGKPVIRHVEGYHREGNSFKNLSRELRKSCGLPPGADLKTPGRDRHGIRNGYYGGNIEAIGDFCVLGSDHFQNNEWKNYAKQFCGDPKNAIKAPSSFLIVGHADEMYKTIPLPNKPAPCNFAVAVASPRKALELMQANSQDKVFNFDSNDPETLEKFYSSPYHDICGQMRDQKSNSSTSKNRGISFLFKLINPAKAGAFVSVYNENLKDCIQSTNSDFLTAYKNDQELSQFNTLVQAQMESFTKDVKAKFKERHNCEPEILELPFLYQGKIVIEDGVKKIEPGTGSSIFPNPSNGEAVNSTMILPDPVVSSFKKYMDEQYAKLGLNTEYIDTHFAHALRGNLHCSSHVLRYCRPKK